MASAEEVSRRVNLQVLKRKDPQINEILDSATQVALYNWNTELNKWEKPDVEGTLFVYSRNDEQLKYGFTIMNRLSIDNLTLGITTEINVHISPPFLLYQNKNTGAPPYGIWFYSQFDCNRISQLVKKLHSEVEQAAKTEPKVKPPPGLFPAAASEILSTEENVVTPDEKDDKVDILGMFRSATDKYIQKTPTTQTPVKKVSLDALFKGATPVLGQSTPNPAPPAENGSNAEKTTKLKSLFGIKDTEQHILAQPIYSSSSNSDAENSHQKFKPISLPDTLAFELQSKIDSDNSCDHAQKQSFAILDDESHSENGLRNSPVSRPNAKQLSRNLFGDSKTELLSPAAFGASIPTESKLINRELLKETLIQLLETDHDFVNRVYTAYIKNVSKQPVS